MSNTETEKQLWVKYQADNGKVVRVSNKVLTSSSSNYHCKKVVATDALVKALTGKISVKKLKAIKEIDSDNIYISEQSDQLFLTAISHKLLKITDNNPNTCDLNVTFHTKKDLIEISINTASIKANMNVSEINELIVNDNTLMNLYVTRKDDPNSLLSSIEVSPEVLFKNKSLFVKVDLSNHVDWNDISVYTTPIFHRYSVVFNHIETENVFDTTDNKYLQQVKINDNMSHINIMGSGRTLSIDSSYITESNTYILDGKNTLKFLICDGNPDKLIGGFVIKSNDIIKKNRHEIPLTFTMPETPLILYKGKDLKVNYLGD